MNLSLVSLYVKILGYSVSAVCSVDCHVCMRVVGKCIALFVCLLACMYVCVERLLLSILTREKV